MKFSIAAARCFDGVTLRGPTTVHVQSGSIAGLSKGWGAADVSLPPGAILSPGFIDLQVNGGGGVMFNDRLDLKGAATIAEAHAARGTTTIFPTLISGSRESVASAMALVERAARSVAGIGGVHIEGPFISQARRGIHPAAHILQMDNADVGALSRDIGVPRIVTLAPESVEREKIAALARSGAIVSIGHSDAGFDEAEAALRAGGRSFTHLFNAMSPIASRAPGVAGAVLASRGAFAGIIVDGLHVHPSVVAIAHAAMGASRLFLVSDAMATAGSHISKFSLYGTRIALRDGRLSDDGGTLAGAHLTMAEAVANCVRLAGIELADALRMATSTPAACARLSDRGVLKVGKRADLVALSGGLRVIGAWRDGVDVFSAR